MKIILFDGVCNLCNGTVQFIIKRDKKAIFKFAPLQSEIGKKLVQKNGSDELDTIVFITDTAVFVKSKAVFAIIKELSGLYKLFLIFAILPTAFTDYIYDLVAKYRYKLFGKKNTCMIPSEEIRSRFVI